MTDDYIATMVLVISFKVLGLAPYAMKKNPESKPSTNTTPRDHGRIKFSISRLGSFYNIVLLAVHLRLLTLGMHTVYSDQYPGKSTVTETIELLVTLFGNSVLTMIYLMLAIRQRAAVRVLNRLLSLHDGISDRNDKYTCESCRNYFLLVSLANLVVLIGIQTMGWLGFEYSFIGMVRIDWPIAIISWFMTQYIFVVKFMYHPLKYVNRRLADCSAATLSVNARRLFVVRDAPLNESLVESVTGLRRVHDELYQIATEVSDFYSFPMLLSITHLVTVVVYSAYYLILPFVVMSDTQTTLMIIHSVVYMICTFLPIAVLTLEITRFTTEVHTLFITWRQKRHAFTSKSGIFLG